MARTCAGAAFMVKGRVMWVKNGFMVTTPTNILTSNNGLKQTASPHCRGPCTLWSYLPNNQDSTHGLTPPTVAPVYASPAALDMEKCPSSTRLSGLLCPLMERGGAVCSFVRWASLWLGKEVVHVLVVFVSQCGQDSIGVRITVIL